MPGALVREVDKYFFVDRRTGALGFFGAVVSTVEGGRGGAEVVRCEKKLDGVILGRVRKSYRGVVVGWIREILGSFSMGVNISEREYLPRCDQNP